MWLRETQDVSVNTNLFKAREDCHVPFHLLLKNMITWLLSLCCLTPRFMVSLREVGEPYDEERQYITAEEYCEVNGGHV